MMSKQVARYSLYFALALCAGAMVSVYVEATSHDLSAECAGLAHGLAERNRDVRERAGFKWTERQAYQACVADPIGFRRLIRSD